MRFEAEAGLLFYTVLQRYDLQQALDELNSGTADELPNYAFNIQSFKLP